MTVNNLAGFLSLVCLAIGVAALLQSRTRRTNILLFCCSVGMVIWYGSMSVLIGRPPGGITTYLVRLSMATGAIMAVSLSLCVHSIVARSAQSWRAFLRSQPAWLLAAGGLICAALNPDLVNQEHSNHAAHAIYFIYMAGFLISLVAKTTMQYRRSVGIVRLELMSMLIAIGLTLFTVAIATGGGRLMPDLRVLPVSMVSGFSAYGVLVWMLVDRRTRYVKELRSTVLRLIAATWGIGGILFLVLTMSTGTEAARALFAAAMATVAVGAVIVYLDYSRTTQFRQRNRLMAERLASVLHRSTSLHSLLMNAEWELASLLDSSQARIVCPHDGQPDEDPVKRTAYALLLPLLREDGWLSTASLDRQASTEARREALAFLQNNDFQFAFTPPAGPNSHVVILVGANLSKSIYNEDDMHSVMPFVVGVISAIDQSVLTENAAKEQKFAVVGRISAAMTHDMAHPLRTMKNMMLALDAHHSDATFRTDNPLFMDSFRQTMKAELQRANLLLQRVQNSQTVQREKTEFNLGALIKARVADARKDCAVHDIELVADIAAEPLIVHADETAISSVVDNLLRNAREALVDYSPKLNSKRIEVSVQREEPGMALMRISDTGPGVADSAVPKLFSDYRTTKKHGFGIGLVNCATAIKQNGGQIRYRHRDDGGATFLVRLATCKEAVTAGARS